MKDQLSHVSFFRGLPEAQLEALAGIVVQKAVKKGEVVFSDGDEAEGFYLVGRGRIKIFKISLDGKEQILHIFGPGEPFGEVPVFEGTVFPAGAEALEDSDLLFFPRRSFIDAIRKNPDLALNMLAVLSRRLRVFTRLIEDLSFKEVPGRLAAYILYLKEIDQAGGDLELDISKGQLASLLGTIPETLSRILGKLKAMGVIEMCRSKITIVDRKALEDIAETGSL